jgi:hypothetical protein
VFAEFGHAEDWSPQPGSYRRLRLDAIVHPSTDWKEISTFDWWAPAPGADLSSYITHRNEPSR